MFSDEQWSTSLENIKQLDKNEESNYHILYKKFIRFSYSIALKIYMLAKSALILWNNKEIAILFLLKYISKVPYSGKNNTQNWTIYLPFILGFVLLPIQNGKG